MSDQQTSKSLHWHKADIEGLGCVGLATLGEGSVELLYCCEPDQRKTLVLGDTRNLIDAGYRTRVVGRNRLVSVDLTNVGSAMDARYVK